MNSGTVKKRHIGYWIFTAITVLAFLIPGLGNIFQVSHIAQDMARLGYPRYFLTLLGTWKVLGSIAIVIPGTPRLKEWAYAGMIFDLTGAAFSRAATGEALLMIVIPLAIACIVFLSWRLRPPARLLTRSS